jgi:diguanylate cyclase (GGDEF)-like protein
MAKRVLIVEDSESMAKLEKRYIERAGFRAEVAFTGSEALELLRDNRDFDLFVIDYKLPDMSGVDFMLKVKDMGMEVPSLIVTAEGNEEVAVSAMKLGAMDYLVKDRETIRRLAGTCMEVLKRYELISENARLMDELKRVNAELSQANMQLVEISKKDDLTEVYNRRFMMETLNYEILRSRRYRLPLSFAIFDLDHFKKVNDTHGHTTGDLVLKQFADIIKDRIRSTDIFGRYGGEEFAIILVGTTLGPAMVLCEELREIVSGSSFGNEHAPLGITTSAGVASLNGDMDKEALIEIADRSLYMAKEEGRDRVVAVELRGIEAG